MTERQDHVADPNWLAPPGNFQVRNSVDEAGNPAGGKVYGIGININWQDGPLGRGEERQAPNGAFIEDVIKACIYRMQFYQDSKFACKENETTLFHLRQALISQGLRTQRRETEGTEGTLQPDESDESNESSVSGYWMYLYDVKDGKVPVQPWYVETLDGRTIRVGAMEADGKLHLFTDSDLPVEVHRITH